MSDKIQVVSSLVTALATVGIFIATVSYVWDTNQIRDLTKRNLLYTHNPNVFVSSLSQGEPLIDNDGLAIATMVNLKNVGNVEARNLRIDYTVEIDGSPGKPLQLEDLVLYPGQESGIRVRFGVVLPTEQVEAARKELLLGKKVSINHTELARMMSGHVVSIVLRVSYDDVDGNSVPGRYFRFNYQPLSSFWVIRTNQSKTSGNQ